MRITLMTVPARGDAEPFVALAVRLAGLGHEVKVATRPDLEDLVRANGISFAPVGNPYQPFIAGAARAGAVGSGHPVAKIRYGASQRRYVSEGLHEDAWQAAQGAEAIIYKYPWITAHTVAEKLGIPCVPVMLLPFLPTTEFPSFVMGRGIERGRAVNRLLWRLPWQAIWSGLRLDDRKLRRELGLPALPIPAPLPLRQSGRTPVLCPWSPSVLPKPVDWPKQVDVTGYWFLDPPDDWHPPTDLVEFIENGPAPVSIGFGSMTAGDPDATLRLVLDALEACGQRGVLLSGWGELGRDRLLPDHVFRAESVPHSWLFPRMAAVVHHGGAGTTGAALRAGVPAIVTPLLADQPSWARRVFALGAGPEPIPFPALTAGRLADAIRVATADLDIRQRAQEVGHLVRGEDGVERAIDLFVQYVEHY